MTFWRSYSVPWVQKQAKLQLNKIASGVYQRAKIFTASTLPLRMDTSQCMSADWKVSDCSISDRVKQTTDSWELSLHGASNKKNKVFRYQLWVHRYSQHYLGFVLYNVPRFPPPSHPPPPLPTSEANLTKKKKIIKRFYRCLSVCICATDVWSKSSLRVTAYTFLSTDASKTFDRVLTSHPLRTVIKLTFVADLVNLMLNVHRNHTAY